MFKKITVFVTFIMNGLIAHAGTFINIEECFNNQSKFKITNEGNSRNGANAKIAESEGIFPFGGVWLWIVSDNSGFLSSSTKYKTMNGGELLVWKQVITGRQGCGRELCNTNIEFYGADFTSPNGEEFSYECI